VVHIREIFVTNSSSGMLWIIGIPSISFAEDLHAQPTSAPWETLQHKRTLVVQFASVERLDGFNLYWKSHELHLLGNLNNASMLLACPSLDVPQVMEHIIKHNNWTLVGTYAHHHPLTYGNLLRFQTPNGVDVLFQPIVITLPRHYMNNPTIPTCAGRTWPLSYAMYSGAVFSYHLMELPFLSKYDFYMKVDTDIEFSSDIPFDIMEDMSVCNCMVGHSRILPSSDCEDGNLQPSHNQYYTPLPLSPSSNFPLHLSLSPLHSNHSISTPFPLYLTILHFYSFTIRFKPL